MTRLQLRNAIKREARIKSAANLDTMVDEIVTDILTDSCNLARYHELLVENVVIVLVAGQQQYSLPADYHNLATARFARGPVTTAVPGVYRELSPQPETVRQTFRNGNPLYYRLVRGSKISLWPYGSTLAADSLLIDYYINPMSVFATDADAFPVPRIEGAVKKDAIARIQRFHLSLQEGQLTDRDGAGSRNAGYGAT